MLVTGATVTKVEALTLGRAGDPSMGYGIDTIKGVTGALLG